MRRVAALRRNKDGTVTLRADGRIVEVFDPNFKGFYEMYEAIKWAAIMADLHLSEDTLTEFLLEAQGL